MSSTTSLLADAVALVDLLTRQSPPKGALPGVSRKQPLGCFDLSPRRVLGVVIPQDFHVSDLPRVSLARRLNSLTGFLVAILRLRKWHHLRIKGLGVLACERATRLRRPGPPTASTSPPLLCPDKFLKERPFSHHIPICDSKNLHVIGSDISTT